VIVVQLLSSFFVLTEKVCDSYPFFALEDTGEVSADRRHVQVHAFPVQSARGLREQEQLEPVFGPGRGTEVFQDSRGIATRQQSNQRLAKGWHIELVS